MHSTAPVLGQEALLQQMSEQSAHHGDGVDSVGRSEAHRHWRSLSKRCLAAPQAAGQCPARRSLSPGPPPLSRRHGGLRMWGVTPSISANAPGSARACLARFQLKRAYYLCPQCHRGVCPLDQQFGFCAGSISAGLDELLALLGCQFSFAHSAELVAHLSLVEVSARSLPPIHRSASVSV